MNRPLGILAAVAFAMLVGCTPSRDNKYEGPYIGTWYAQGQESSFTWRLDKSGDFGEDPGFVTPVTDDGTWRVDRGELILRKADKTEERVKANVVGNTMTVEQDGQTIIFTRITK
jgi:hypothetical protein